MGGNDISIALALDRDCPCRITLRPDLADMRHVVACVTHGEEIVRIAAVQHMSRAELMEALEPCLAHVRAHTPGLAQVTIAEREAWGWWDSRADAEGVESSATPPLTGRR